MLLQRLAEVRVAQGFAVFVGNEENVFYPLTQGGNFCVGQSHPVIQENLANTGQQAGAVRGDHFNHRALIDGVVGEGHFGGKGEVLQLARGAPVDDVRVVFRVIQFFDQAFAHPLFTGGVDAQRLALLIQHHVGADGIRPFAGVDAGVDNVQVQLLQHGRSGRKQVCTVFHVDDDLGIAVCGPAPGVANQHQRVRVVAMADDGGGLPGNVHGGILQEVFLVDRVPDFFDLFVGHVLGVQDFPGFFPGGVYPGLAVYRGVDTAAQGPLGFDIQLAQQGSAPGVPEFRVGGADVAHRQNVQVIQVGLAGHSPGKGLDDVRVCNVLALGGHGHEQVVLYQPGDQLGIPFAQVMPLAESLGINGAQLGMVATPALGDIVVKAGNIQGVQLGKPVNQPRGQGVFCLGLGAGQSHHVADYPHGMGVHGINMEQVVLHLADDLAKLRQVAAQHVVLLHGRQGLVQRVRGAQQLHEQGGYRQVVTEGVINQVPVGPQRPDGGGANAFDLRVLRHQHKNFHDGVGGVGKDLVIDRFYIQVAHLEAFVERADFVFTAAAQDRLVVKLQQYVGNLGQGQYCAVVLLHHQFNAQPLAFVLITQHLGQGPLVIKQQAVLVAVSNQLQTETQAPQEGFAFVQNLVFFFGQDAEAGEVRHALQAEVALGNPADGLDVPQGAWGAFYVGLQVVLGVAVFLVALLLFFPLGDKVGLVGADFVGIGLFAQGLPQAVGPGDGTGLQQVGKDRDIFPGGSDGFIHAAHAVADIEFQVPQQGNKGAQIVLPFGRHAFAGENQQVDIGVGVQFTPAVATYGNQGDVFGASEGVPVPDQPEDGVYGICP